MLDGIKNFLEFVNNNWTTIVVIISLVAAITKKAADYLKKSDDEKIAIAKERINEIMLKLVTDAEKDYEEWNKSGMIKRSQVIKEIFEQYPILAKVVDQEALIKWIDESINNALKTLREIIAQNEVEAAAE